MSDTARPKSGGDKLSAEEVNADLPVPVVAGETLNGTTLPVAVYMDDTDNEVKACDGNDATKLEFIGFVITNSTDGNPITLQTHGVVDGFSGLDIGKFYYVQDDKTIGTTRGTLDILVGIAVSATQILIIFGNNGYISNEVFNANNASATTVNDTVTLPAGANLAIIQCTFNDVSGLNSQTQLIIKRKGSISGTFEEISSAGDTSRIRASLSGSTITITGTVTGVGAGNITISGTAYFYR